MKCRVMLQTRIGGECISFPARVIELLDGHSYWRKVMVRFSRGRDGRSGGDMIVAIGDLMADSDGCRITATAIRAALRTEAKKRKTGKGRK